MVFKARIIYSIVHKILREIMHKKEKSQKNNSKVQILCQINRAIIELFKNCL